MHLYREVGRQRWLLEAYTWVQSFLLIPRRQQALQVALRTRLKSRPNGVWRHYRLKEYSQRPKYFFLASRFLTSLPGANVPPSRG